MALKSTEKTTRKNVANGSDPTPQLIGKIARKKGFKGIIFKSARSDLSAKGWNYVIFADKPIDAVIKPKNVSYTLKPVGVDY